jgi:hypothetical protein
VNASSWYTLIIWVGVSGLVVISSVLAIVRTVCSTVMRGGRDARDQ